MENLNDRLTELLDQTWQIARETLDRKETRVYRSLTDIAEKLTDLIGSAEKSPASVNRKEDLLPIFARYQGERYEAQLDTTRIHGGRGQCVLMEGSWWSTSGSAIHIKQNSAKPPNRPETAGWTDFWKYNDKSSNTEQTIDGLRRNKESTA